MALKYLLIEDIRPEKKTGWARFALECQTRFKLVVGDMQKGSPIKDGYVWKKWLLHRHPETGARALLRVTPDVIAHFEAEADKLAQSIPDGLPLDKWMNLRGDIYMDYRAIVRQWKTVCGYQLKPLDKIGTLFTLKEFIEMVESGGFIDYDGWGYYSNGKMQTNIIAHASDIKVKVYRKDFSHIKWYNR